LLVVSTSVTVSLAVATSWCSTLSEAIAALAHVGCEQSAHAPTAAFAAGKRASRHAPTNSAKAVEFTVPPLIAKNRNEIGPVVGGGEYSSHQSPRSDAKAAAPLSVPFTNSCTVLLGGAVPDRLSWLAQVVKSPTMPVSGDEKTMVVGIGVGCDVGREVGRVVGLDVGRDVGLDVGRDVG
jgi:hypothetical protein